MVQGGATPSVSVMVLVALVVLGVLAMLAARR
jgi:MYXO-CTERM domain-containing protein